MTIFFDENMPRHLVEGFAQIQKLEGLNAGVQATIKYIPTEFYKGVKDEEWILQLTKGKSFVVTQDVNITRRKQEIALYQKQGIGLFLLRGSSKKQGLGVWQMVECLAKHWPFILETIKSQKPPFAYEVKPKGQPKKWK